MPAPGPDATHPGPTNWPSAVPYDPRELTNWYGSAANAEPHTVDASVATANASSRTNDRRRPKSRPYVRVGAPAIRSRPRTCVPRPCAGPEPAAESRHIHRVRDDPRSAPAVGGQVRLQAIRARLLGDVVERNAVPLEQEAAAAQQPERRGPGNVTDEAERG